MRTSVLMIASHTVITIFLVVTIILTVSGFLRRTTVKSPTAHLLRSLFPSWRFYEEVTEVPVLQFRVSIDGTQFGDWVTAVEKPKLEWHSLFLNRSGNLFHAEQSLLQLLESEIGDLPAVNAAQIAVLENGVSFQLASNLVQYFLREQLSLAEQFFQFRLLRVRQGEQLESGEEFLRSSAQRIAA